MADPDRDAFFTVNFSESFEDSDEILGHNVDASLQLVLSKFGNKIFDSFETMRFSGS